MSADVQQQIAQVQADIRRLEREAARIQTEINDLEAELADFEARYQQIVEPVRAKLRAAQQAVEDLERQRYLEQYADVRPLEAAFDLPPDHVPVEEQYRRVWGQPRAAEPSIPKTKPLDAGVDGDPEAALKRLYRLLARRYHPDLATSAADRGYRTRLMALINQAYAEQDLDSLRMLADLGDQANPDEPVAVLRLRALRGQRDALQARVNELNTTRTGLLHNALMQLKVEETLARQRGRNFLRELADQYEREYAQVMAILTRLRRRG